MESKEMTGGPAAGPDARALGIIKDHVNRLAQGGGDWETTPEVPSGGEILSAAEDMEDLPHNNVGTVWPSKEAYLATHYALLRREGVEGLRFAVNLYRQHPEIRDDRTMCIYKRVRLVGYLMARISPICRISFSTENSDCKISWPQSRRLTPGTVVALSTKADNFKSVCLVATVAQRPYKDGLDQNPPMVDIIWARPSEAVIDPEQEMVMVESRIGYFEAVRHALVGLQISASYESPIDKYLLSGDTSDLPARFVTEDPVVDMSSVVHRPGPSFDWDKIRQHNLLHGVPDIQDATTMDNSQLHALHRIVAQEFAVIQGPPGTGKTFTSVAALRVILANRKASDPPIIVAAQTNHALDQLLSLLLDVGARILRVGGRTSNERVSEHTPFEMRRRSRATVDHGLRRIDGAHHNNAKKLRALAKTTFTEDLIDPEVLVDAGVLTAAQHHSLVDDDMEQSEAHEAAGPFSLWLGEECIPAEVLRESDRSWLDGDDADLQVEEHEQDDGEVEHIAYAEEEDDRIPGLFVPFKHTLAGKEPSRVDWRQRAEQELNKQDLFAIPRGMRGAVYQLLVSRFLAKLQPEFVGLINDSIELCNHRRAIRWEADTRLVQQECVDVVGCTTTGLTKYRGFLAALQPRTMLIEEAAETREANISSALYPSIQQLILVGDHQQLAPVCDVSWLGQAPFNMNISLFERMVDMGLPYIMLDQQRRMIPAIRSILSPFYPELTDHPLVTDVTERPPVPGMGGHNAWLFTHDWEEGTDANRSKFNDQEADMVVNFFAYLVANGVSPDQITILTFYNGQRKALLGKLRKHGSITSDSFNVFTVDSYQGEENDIVLLSLVRSPSGDRPYAVGFLENQNRAVVAISRARRGFYLFGNMDNVLRAHDRSFELWGRIWNGFAEMGCVKRRQGLPLTCQAHNKETWIREVSDWGDNAGGCDDPCGAMRPCGHECTLKCHNTPHESLGCSQPCQLTLDCEHGCANMCGQVCHCPCDLFGVMKQKSHNLALQSEAHLHMTLEEILLNEAGQSSLASPGSPGSRASYTSPSVDDSDETQPTPKRVAPNKTAPKKAPKKAAPKKISEKKMRDEKIPDKKTRQQNFDKWVRAVKLEGERRGQQAKEDAEETNDTASRELIQLADASPPNKAAKQAIQHINSTWKPTKLVNGRRANAGPTSVFHIVHSVVGVSGHPVEAKGTPASQGRQAEDEEELPSAQDELLIEL